MYSITLEHRNFVYILAELRRLYVEGNTDIDLSKLIAKNTKYVGK